MNDEEHILEPGDSVFMDGPGECWVVSVDYELGEVEIRNPRFKHGNMTVPIESVYYMLPMFPGETE